MRYIQRKKIVEKTQFHKTFYNNKQKVSDNSAFHKNKGLNFIQSFKDIIHVAAIGRLYQCICSNI